MAPGTSGGDVRQLEEALARLGFDPGTVDGNYDQKTSAAVERMYKKAGWDPYAPTREQRAAVSHSSESGRTPRAPSLRPRPRAKLP